MIVLDLFVDVPFSTSYHNSLYFPLIVNCDGSYNSRLFDNSDHLYDFDNVIYNYLSNID